MRFRSRIDDGMVENSSVDLQNNNNNCVPPDAVQLHDSKHQQHVSMCIGCGQKIFDRYILRVAPDLEWHAACLKCTQCHQYLDESCTAFVREGKTYCKNDYVRLFGTKCAKCDGSFDRNDCVMRARHRIFHLDCFRCVHCNKKLMPGDEFALRDEQLYCKADHDQQEKVVGDSVLDSIGNGLCMVETGMDDQPLGGPVSLTSLNNSGQLSMITSPMTSPLTSLPSQTGLSPPQHSVVVHEHRSKKDKKDKPKTTRVRTVLNEKQLHTLRTCYNANPRPDALMKEQLTEMTGLSSRVIRVWFQNKRCKDKKRQILMKHMQQQHEKGFLPTDCQQNGFLQNQALNGVRMQGIGPLIAASPTTHEQMTMVQPLEVQQFAQNSALWTPLQPPEPSCSLDSQTPFQQLIHGFGDPNSDPTIGSYMGGGNTGSFHSGVSMDTSEMDSFSPQMAPSDLSSPSCSE